MDKLEQMIDKVMRFIMAMSMLSLVIGGFWQIFTRWVLNDPSTFTEEFMRYMLIWAAMIGSAYCFYKNEHLAFDLFKNKATGKLAIFLTVFVEVVVISFISYVFIYGGFRLAAGATNASPVMQIPFYIIYSILPISGLFIVLARILKYIKIFKTRREVK